MDVSIPPGVYSAINGFITSLATNHGDDIAFNWVEPVKIHKIDRLLEINYNQYNFHANYSLKYEELE